MIPSLEIKAAFFAATFLVGSILGGWTVHKVDAGRYTALELSISQAHEKALAAAIAEQQRADEISRQAAVQEAAQQRTLATRLQLSLNQVNKHAHALGHCLPLGYVRVLFAGSHGQLPDDLPLAGGKSDDSCAAAGWTGLLSGLLRDQGTALANAKQLEALIANVRAIHQDATKK